MTDKETLFSYRWNESLETLSEARKMLELNFSPRSIINRSYYAMFYAVLALFLHEGISIKSSKHVGVISLFDKEFIQKKIFDKDVSIMLHQAFNDRQEFDYKEHVEPDRNAARDIADKAGKFIDTLSAFFF